MLNSKPLIHYTIEAARSVFPDDVICVSSDSDEIIEVAKQTGLPVPLKRSAELATDTAGTQDVLLHALEFYEKRGYNPDVLILLQPTSPFRTKRHIKEALNLYSQSLDMIVSVKEAQGNPYFTLFEESENGYLDKSKLGDFTRRQDCPKVWELNGAIYIINTKSIKKQPITEFNHIKKYVMSKKSSIDIDDQLDWNVAELLIRETPLYGY